MTCFSLEDRVIASRACLRRLGGAGVSGTVTNLLGLRVDIEGLNGVAAIGDRLELRRRDHRTIPAEVIGFSDGALQAMAFGPLDGLTHGAEAALVNPYSAMLDVAPSWLGRVIDPLGAPL
ncbi:MAG: flagellum-specific ATP synthase FliI, partial [Rhodopila sp.]